MKCKWPFLQHLLEISTALSFLFACPQTALASSEEQRSPCANALISNLERFATAYDDVQITSVASGLVLRRHDLHSGRMQEFLRLQLRSIKGTYWELAVYAASDRDRGAVAKKVERWSWDPYAFGIMDMAPELYLGPRKLKAMARRMETHPHLAEMILRHGSFGILRQPIENASRLEFAEHFRTDKAYFAAVSKLDEIESELNRRHLTSNDLQLVVTPEGGIYILNPETLRQGTNAELKEVMQEKRKTLRDLRP